METTEYRDLSRLSDKELLSIMVKDSTVSQRLLNEFGGLRGIYKINPTRITNIDKEKIGIILTGFELGKRLLSLPPEEKVRFSEPKDVVDILMPQLRYLQHEEFKLATVDTKNSLLNISTISKGTLNSSLIHPRELFKMAIYDSAASIILIHNHPSGDTTPSQVDLKLTDRINEASKIIGIHLLDHLIIGDGTYLSFKEKGILKIQ